MSIVAAYSSLHLLPWYAGPLRLTFVVYGKRENSERSAERLNKAPSLFHQNKVALGSNQLRNKALLALEETVQECRFCEPRRTFALRFALAYLWSTNKIDRAPLDAFWRALSRSDMWRFQGADQALSAIYASLALRRDHEVGMKLWAEQWEARKLEQGGREFDD